MNSKFRKSCIFIGQVGAYCVACERELASPAEVEAHEALATHADCLRHHPHLDKYGDDNIRKIKLGYFCDYCGMLLPTAVKVNMHVASEGHRSSKACGVLRAVSVGGARAVVAFEAVLVGADAWHAIAERACALCDRELLDREQHTREPAHLVKLLHAKVQLRPGKQLYRMIDESLFQCMTCNQVHALDKMDDHFDSDGHNKQYSKLEQEFEKLNIKCSTAVVNENVDNGLGTRDVVSGEPLPGEGKDDEDSENSKCTAETNGPEGETHLNDDRARTFAKENNLSYNVSGAGGQSECKLCDKTFPSTLKGMKEHVFGKYHVKKMNNVEKLRKEKSDQGIIKVPTGQFIENFIKIKHEMFGNMVVLNDNICIKDFSFVLFTLNDDAIRCQVCEVNIRRNASDINSHLDSRRHRKAVKQTPVITSLENEFVREIRPCVYHCGYCNLVIPCWADVDAHLKSSEHVHLKGFSQWVHSILKPGIHEHRMRERFNEHLMLLPLLQRLFN